MSDYVLVYLTKDGQLVINNLGPSKDPLVAAVNPNVAANGVIGLDVGTVIPMPTAGNNIAVPLGNTVAIKVDGDVEFDVIPRHVDISN